jgi:hypothetical protein
MSLFPAYSGGDSVPENCNEQDIKKDDEVVTGWLCCKEFYLARF